MYYINTPTSVISPESESACPSYDMTREAFRRNILLLRSLNYPNTRAFVTIIIPIIQYCVYNYNTLYIQKRVSAVIFNGSSQSPKTLNICNYILRLLAYMHYCLDFSTCSKVFEYKTRANQLLLHRQVKLNIQLNQD